MATTAFYDYDVQAGGAFFGSESQGQTYHLCSGCPTQRLSDIYKEDQANPFKSENWARAGALGDDTLKAVGVGQALNLIKLGKSSEEVVRVLELLSASEDLLDLLESGKIKQFLIKQAVPGSSTYYEVNRQRYRAGDKVEGGSTSGGWKTDVCRAWRCVDKKGKTIN